MWHMMQQEMVPTDVINQNKQINMISYYKVQGTRQTQNIQTIISQNNFKLLWTKHRC